MQDFWKLKRKKNIGLLYQPLKLKPINAPRFKDTDRDKIPDRYDCAPRNPHRQGVLHYVKGALQKREAPKVQARAEDLMSEADHYIQQGNFFIKKGQEEFNEDLIEYGEQLRAQGEKMMQQALKLQEEAQVSFTQGEALAQREAEAIKKDVKKGLKIKPEYYKSARKYVEGPAVPRISRPRRLLPEEKLSPNFQQSSVFGPMVCPYRPLGVRQCLPKLGMITSPFAQRMRTGQPYVFPRPYSSFKPVFAVFKPPARRREVDYYEEQ